MDRAKKEAQEKVEKQMLRLRDETLKNVPEHEQRHVFPDDTYSLIDRMDSHQKGRRFKYAVISTQPVADQSGALNWLRGYKPKNEKANVLLDDISPLNISGEFAYVDLEQALRGYGEESRKEYCLISDVFVHYVPLIPFQSNSQAVDICIRDDRYAEPRIVRQARISGNVSYNILMSLDYCFQTKDLSDFKLTIACHQKSLKDGKTWAMARVIVGLSFFTMAVKNNVRETMAVIQWADSDLQEYVTDPTRIDMLVTAEGYKRLKQRKAAGELENTTEPEDDLMGMVTAATVINGTKSSKDAPVSGLVQLMKSRAREQELSRDEERVLEDAFAPSLADPNELTMTTSPGAKKARFRSPPPSMSGRSRASSSSQSILDRSTGPEVRGPRSMSPTVEDVPEDYEGAFLEEIMVGENSAASVVGLPAGGSGGDRGSDFMTNIFPN